MYAKTCCVSKWNLRARLKYLQNSFTEVDFCSHCLRPSSSQPEDTRAVKEATTFKWKVEQKKNTDIITLFWSSYWMIDYYWILLTYQFLFTLYFGSAHPGQRDHSTGENSHQASLMIHLMFHSWYQKSHSAQPYVFIYFRFLLVCKVSSYWKNLHKFGLLSYYLTCDRQVRSKAF